MTDELRNATLAPFAEEMYELLCVWHEAFQEGEMIDHGVETPNFDAAIEGCDTLLRELKLRLGE